MSVRVTLHFERYGVSAVQSFQTELQCLPHMDERFEFQDIVYRVSFIEHKLVGFMHLIDIHLFEIK